MKILIGCLVRRPITEIGEPKMPSADFGPHAIGRDGTEIAADHVEGETEKELREATGEKSRQD